MSQRRPRTLTAALKCCGLAFAAAAACTPAWAVDWGGYFRVGPGGSQRDASRACYSLPGDGLKYRLGNECDLYGEFLFSQGFENEGVKYKAAVMFNASAANSGGDDADAGLNQVYVEAQGFDVAPNATFWIGKRFYGRADVHIVDTFFTNMSGVGAGVSDITAGPGKLAFAWFHSDLDNTRSGNRFNAEFYDLPVNEGGTLRLVGTLAHGNFSDDPATPADESGKSGAGFTVQHKQEGFLGLGGANTMWFQLAQGSAALNGNFGDLTAPSGSKAWRLVESFTWQRGSFGGQALAMVQRDLPDAAAKITSMSLGGRAAYAFTRNFKLVGEVGYSQRKADGGPTAKLAKFTLAPALSTGPGFWNRPELRLYVTTAKWNAAAGNVTGVPAFAGKTSGTSYGAQVEMWF